MNPVSAGDWVLMGKALGPHGRDGLLRVLSYAGSEATFENAGEVLVRTRQNESRTCRVISARPHKKTLLVRLEGIRFRDEAEQFRDAEIYVRKDGLAREEDEYFWYELIGLSVFLEEGAYVGRITEIISRGGNDIYVIQEGSREYYLPATREVILEIDLEGGKMIISDVEGLLELNAV